MAYIDLQQTWDLSKILHRRNFRLKLLHRQCHLISKVLVIKKFKKMSENGEFYTAGQKFSLLPAVTALTNLTSVKSSSLTWATVTTSTSFEEASSHARVTSLKFTKRQWVSQSLSHWQALPMIGLGSDKEKDSFCYIHTLSFEHALLV